MIADRQFNVFSADLSTDRDGFVLTAVFQNSLSSITNKIHENLHDLDGIANYIRNDSRQLVNHLDTGIFLLDQTSELHCVGEYAIQRHTLQCCRAAFSKRSDVLNNFVDARSLIGNLSIDLQHLSLVYSRRPVNHFQRCIGISGNRGERLIDFVRNRRGHLAERNEARRVFHLTGLLFEFLLIDFSLSDVEGRLKGDVRAARKCHSGFCYGEPAAKRVDPNLSLRIERFFKRLGNL